MSGEKAESTVLRACLGKPQELAKLVDYSLDSIVSKTILDKPVGTITLFAFDQGQRLSEHQVAYDAVVEVIEGQALITIGGEDSKVCAGELIIMPANVPHAVVAEKKFKMVLIMIRA